MIKYLYIDDFEDKNAWINICKMFGIFLDNNLRCIKTNYIIVFISECYFIYFVIL